MTNSSSELDKQHQIDLLAGAKRLGLDLGELEVDQLLAYLALLNKWNKAYNLTAIRDSRQMVALHLLDSLAIIPELKRLPADKIAPQAQWLDVGSGGGLPGIVLAIMCPQINFTLMDSNGKKTRFLQQVQLELGLKNLNVVKSRVESFVSDKSFAVICSRAFASLQDMVNWSRHLLAQDSIYFAMKGQQPDDELRALPDDIQLLSSSPLSVPGVEGERHLILLQPS